MTRPTVLFAAFGSAVLAAVSCTDPLGRACGTETMVVIERLDHMDGVLHPGDTGSLRGAVWTTSAYMDESGHCDWTIYTSETRPSVFKWQSSDTSVATVIDGTVTARAPGLLKVSVTSAKKTTAAILQVVEAKSP